MAVFALMFVSTSLAQYDYSTGSAEQIVLVDNSKPASVVSNDSVPAPIQPIISPPVVAPVDLNPVGGSSGGGSGGGSRHRNSDDEGSGRRLNKSPLTELGNNLKEDESLESSRVSGFSKITGAVVGVFGKRGTLGIGIFIVVLGVAGLVVYNRQRLGIVKKAN